MVTVDEKEHDKREIRGRRHLLHILYSLQRVYASVVLCGMSRTNLSA